MTAKWKDSWGDGSIWSLKELWRDRSIHPFLGMLMALTGWSETINDEGHMLIIEWSLTWIEEPLRLPCCSLYINQSLLLSFLYFLLKSIIRAHLSSLSNNIVQLLHPSYIFSLSTFNLVSILVNSSSIFLLQNLYVSVIPYKLVKI